MIPMKIIIYGIGADETDAPVQLGQLGQNIWCDQVVAEPFGQTRTFGVTVCVSGEAR